MTTEEPIHSLCCAAQSGSVFDLRAIVSYLGRRTKLLKFGPGRVEATLTATQRRNFRRFLDRHDLTDSLTADSGARQCKLT